MNNLKFRVWDLTENCFLDPWDEVDPQINLLGDVFLWDRIQQVHTNIKYKTNGLIIQQFTSLLDKNGKEIYEGDILAYPIGNFDRAADNFDDRMRISYRNELARYVLNFYSKWGGEGYSGAQENITNYTNDCIIIGNIYENPDLLNPIDR